LAQRKDIGRKGIGCHKGKRSAEKEREKVGRKGRKECPKEANVVGSM